MLIEFKNKKLEKTFNSEKELNKIYGKLTKKIQIRMAVLRGANNLSLVRSTPPERRHKLSGNKAGKWAVDLDKNNRLIFEPITELDHNEIDPVDITAIRILKVEDYH